MKINLDWQKRATILFAALVLMFSVILAAFAIREAEREKSLKQKEMSQEQERIAASIIDQLRSAIQETEERSFRLLSSAKGALPLDGSQLANIANTIEEQESLVSDIFYIGSNGQIHFPLFKPLYRMSIESGYPAPEIGPLKIEDDPLFFSGETSEFKMHNYSLAIESYRQLLRATSDRASRALLLNRIARCSVLAGNPSAAIRTFKQIVNDHPQEVSPDGIPYALIALYQTGVLYAENNNESESIETYLELYQSLLEPQWPLNRVQFYFYLKKIKDELDILKQKMDTTGIDRNVFSRQTDLEQTEREKLERMDGLETIAKKMFSVFLTRERDSGTIPGTFFRFYEHEKTEGKPFLITYTFPDSESLFGFSMNDKHLIEKILPSILAKTSLRERFMVQISDEENIAIAGETNPMRDTPRSQLIYSRAFENNFFPWKINIYQSYPSEAERQFRLRRNIYILSVGIVIVAILFGGVIAIRSTAKELRLAKLKSEFVSTVSHEFRTPLTSIRYLAELLQRGRVQEESKKQQYYESITYESERLSRLIENLLDFSKIEAGMKEYEFKKTEMAEMCREVASRFQQQVDPREFAIESEIPERLPEIFADKEALSRALFNLMDNAVKYSGDSRTINFRAWSNRESICLQIKDQGIGISKDKQDKVFNKFYRSGDVHDSSIKGSGIGLTIVAHIARAHGGEVLLESDLGKGTEVTIRLPIDRKIIKGG